MCCFTEARTYACALVKHCTERSAVAGLNWNGVVCYKGCCLVMAGRGLKSKAAEERGKGGGGSKRRETSETGKKEDRREIIGKRLTITN